MKNQNDSIVNPIPADLVPVNALSKLSRKGKARKSSSLIDNVLLIAAFMVAFFLILAGAVVVSFLIVDYSEKETTSSGASYSFIGTISEPGAL